MEMLGGQFVELEFRGVLPRVRDLMAGATGRNEVNQEKYREAREQRAAPRFMVEGEGPVYVCLHRIETERGQW